MSSHDAFDEAVAAYAIDALDEGERQSFEAHLATCALCQRELEELRAVSLALGTAIEPAEPSADLRARTLARAVAQPQPGVDRIAPIVSPMRASAAPLRPSGSRSWGWLAAAASLVAAVGLGTYAYVLQGQVRDLRSVVATATAQATTLRNQLLAARLDAVRLSNAISVLRAPDMIRVDLKGTGPAAGATARAYLSRAQGIAFSFEHLPVLTPDRTYQLWVVPPGQGAAPVSAGVFDPDASGAISLTVPMPPGVERAVALAVSVEPAGGSVKATTSPVLLGVTPS